MSSLIYDISYTSYKLYDITYMFDITNTVKKNPITESETQCHKSYGVISYDSLPPKKATV